MYVRTSYEYYLERVDKYFKALLAQVSHLQFYTENGAKGGPIIMVQVNHWLFMKIRGLGQLKVSL